MKYQHFVTAALAAVVSFSTLAAGQKQLDIALEGPWILYQDQTFRDDKIPVLIAIAPLAAAPMDEPPDVDDIQHHHQPQISAGEGYYIGDQGIYCLDFEYECAQKGATSLKDDSGRGQLLHIPPGTSTPWPWPKRSNGSVAIVLPMPDFYSNDGLWQVRFRNAYDIKYSSVTTGYDDKTISIGIILHYSKGPTALRLFTCDAPSSKKCTTQTKDRDGNYVILRNTGTVRMQLRAPDADSDCDHHVRFAYHQMYKVFEDSSNYGFAYIEPAKHIKIDSATGDATGEYESEKPGEHPCFDDDHDAYQDQGLPIGSLNMKANGNEHAVHQSQFAGELTFLSDLDKEPGLESLFLKGAIDNLNAANEEYGKLKGIRRISVDRHFEALLSDSIALIEKFRRQKEGKLTPNDEAQLLEAETYFRNLADGTKNGADCRAPLVLLQ